MLLITLRDLQWRRRRFAIAVAVTSMVLGLALLLSGVSASFTNEADRTLELIHVDAWLVRSGDATPFTGPSAVDAGAASAVASIQGVEAASPIIVTSATARLEGSVRNVNVIGVVPGGVGDPTAIDAGSSVILSGDALVDTSLGLERGEGLRLAGHSTRVVGLVRGITYFAGIPTVFLPIWDVQQMRFGGEPLATAIVTWGFPREAPAGLEILSGDEVREDVLRPVAQARQTIALIRGLLWIVAAGIVGAIVYMSALERTGDFAVMKAAGAANRSLLSGLLVEAVVLASASAGMAILLEAAMAPLAAMSVEVPASAYATLPAVALLMGGIASAAALRRTIRVEPALAFGSPS